MAEQDVCGVAATPFHDFRANPEHSIARLGLRIDDLDLASAPVPLCHSILAPDVTALHLYDQDAARRIHEHEVTSPWAPR